MVDFVTAVSVHQVALDDEGCPAKDEDPSDGEEEREGLFVGVSVKVTSLVQGLNLPPLFQHNADDLQVAT